MKKFLAVFDGYKMSSSTIDYAIQLTKASGAHLVGVFLDDIIYRSYSVYKVLTSSDKPDADINILDAADKKKRDDAVKLFQHTCGKAGINYSIHRDKQIAIKELKQESMFADLVIINEYETFTKYKEKPPTRFIKDLLADVQCPVLIVPNNYKTIDKVVLLYDGRPSSLYAAKMFSYLFADLQDLPIEVFTVKDYYMASLNLPNNKLMREFIKRHFKNATYTVVKGNVEEQVMAYMHTHKKNVLLVAGAYQRGDISRFFRSSIADVLMKELDTPLFIAHK